MLGKNFCMPYMTRMREIYDLLPWTPALLPRLVDDLQDYRVIHMFTIALGAHSHPCTPTNARLSYVAATGTDLSPSPSASLSVAASDSDAQYPLCDHRSSEQQPRNLLSIRIIDLLNKQPAGGDIPLCVWGCVGCGTWCIFYRSIVATYNQILAFPMFRRCRTRRQRANVETMSINWTRVVNWLMDMEEGLSEGRYLRCDLVKRCTPLTQWRNNGVFSTNLGEANRNRGRVEQKYLAC